MRIVDVDTFMAGDAPVLDVRSPGEYAQGHMPRALSMPLFSDEERARVGTTYKQIGPKEAFSLGLDLVGPKMSDFVAFADDHNLDGRVSLYCWRGGKRSQSVGWLLEQAGLEVTVLEGGYRAYRQHGRRRLGEQARLMVLGGHTGCGKTEILKRLADKGEQVLDLEGLANHRGSAFGGIGLGEQPSNEQYFNLVWDQWSRFDPDRVIWVENESARVGRVRVPEPLFEQMTTAPLLLLNAPVALREHHLLELYGGQPAEEIEAALLKITKRLGSRDTNKAIADLAEGDLKAIVHRLLHYYDKQYQFAVNRTDPSRMRDLTPDPLPQTWEDWLEHSTNRLMDYAHDRD